MRKDRAEYDRKYNVKIPVVQVRLSQELKTQIPDPKSTWVRDLIIKELESNSRIKNNNSRIKNNNSRIKNNESRINENIAYNSLRWKKTRIVVLKRDKFTCQVCGKKPAKFVHHINLASHTPEMVFDFDNLITVCKNCHDNWHERNPEGSYH